MQHQSDRKLWWNAGQNDRKDIKKYWFSVRVVDGWIKLIKEAVNNGS